MIKILLSLLLLQVPVIPGKPSVRGSTATPRNGAELTTALAQGGVIELQPNTIYAGNFVIRHATQIRTAGVNITGRITPTTPVATLSAGNSGIVLLILASDVSVRGIRIADSTSNDTIQVGQLDGQASTTQQPRNVILDQIIITGADGANTAKRGVALHCGDCGVTNSHIANIKRVGQDSQAIWVLNGTGPFTIANNYLEAAGENFMSGGDTPRIPDLVPENFIIRDNYFTKPLAWRGTTITVKNLIEFKAGRHILIDNNIFENLWQGGQPGWSIVFTPQGLPSVQVADIRFTNNIVREVSSGFNILGYAQIGSSLQTCDIIIDHNWFQLSRTKYGGQGWFMQIGSGLNKISNACRISVIFNTIEQDGGQFIGGTGPPVSGFQFHTNIVAITGVNGLFLTDATGTNQPHGKNWQEYFPGGMIEDNALVGADSVLQKNIPTNLFSSVASIVAGRGVGPFVSYGR